MKQNILNWIVTAIFLVSLVVCYFFWHCDLDLIVTIIAAVVAAVGIALLSFQNKKIKELTPEE